MNEEPLFTDDGKINDRRHKQDHSWLSHEIERRKKTQQRVEKVKTSLLTGFIFSIFSGLGAVVWYAVKSFIGAHK